MTGSMKDYFERLNEEEGSQKYLYRDVQKTIKDKKIYFTSKESLLNYLCGYWAFMIGR